MLTEARKINADLVATEKVSFTLVTITEQKDLTSSHTGEVVNRDIILVTAKKQT